MWNLKYDTNELIYETENHRQNRLEVAKREGVGDGIEGVLGIADANCYIQNG